MIALVLAFCQSITGSDVGQKCTLDSPDLQIVKYKIEENMNSCNKDKDAVINRFGPPPSPKMIFYCEPDFTKKDNDDVIYQNFTFGIEEKE